MNRNRKRTMNLQMFADGENNNQNVRSYQLEFKKMLAAVFGVQSYFGDFFGGGLEVLDGVSENETAFYIKTSDIPVAIGDDYKADADVAFGEGTGKSTRFGPRTEITYKNTPVPYTWEWVIHEGLDRHTVNNDLEAALADRLDLQAQAKVAKFNEHHAKFISDNAGKIISAGADVTKDNVADVFNQLSAYFVNAKVKKGLVKVAKVTSTVFNAIVDSGLSTTAKHSNANVDENTIRKFKGFQIEELPEDAFQSNEVILAYVTNIGRAFTGINTTRTIESEDFDGIALQGAGNAGEYVLPANKKAIAKVTVAGA